ncbi:MAG: class I SAM-dependent methyltransferase [Pseudonocardiaceae bacterium]
MQGSDQQYLPAGIDADTESARLQLLEACHDPGTIRRLDRLGISQGWRCCEVGAGNGSIARWLAERVGPTGSVLAADIDLRFLTNMPAGVDVRRLDIRYDDIEADTYDLIHCRAVLMHLPDPAAALARMVAALRPGGLFLLEEGDYGLWNYGGHPDAPRMNTLVTRVLTELAEARIADPWFGRGLPDLVLATGLELHGGEVETRIARPGDAHCEFERVTAAATVPVMIKLGIYGETDTNLIHSVSSHLDSVITTMSLVSVWGQKPS